MLSTSYQGKANLNSNNTLQPTIMSKMEKTDHTEGWQGCAVTGTFLHCWWECKTESPF